MKEKKKKEEKQHKKKQNTETNFRTESLSSKLNAKRKWSFVDFHFDFLYVCM